MYTPVLKWRQGEYQALDRLTEWDKERIQPFFILPHIEFDFEARRPKKNLQEHIDGFLTRYPKKWGGCPAFR